MHRRLVVSRGAMFRYRVVQAAMALQAGNCPANAHGIFAPFAVLFPSATPGVFPSQHPHVPLGIGHLDRFSSRDRLIEKPVTVDRPRLLGLVIADEPAVRRINAAQTPCAALGFLLAG